jgi:hypothetical protein
VLGGADVTVVEAKVIQPCADMRAHPERADEAAFGQMEDEEALFLLGREACALDDADSDLGCAVTCQITATETERRVGKGEG